MLNPFVDLLATLLQLYSYCIILWIIISMLISFNVINKHQPFVARINYALDRLCDPVMKPIRKRLPDLGGFDISPILVLVFINFLQAALYRYFYNL